MGDNTQNEFMKSLVEMLSKEMSQHRAETSQLVMQIAKQSESITAVMNSIDKRLTSIENEKKETKDESESEDIDDASSVKSMLSTNDPNVEKRPTIKPDALRPEPFDGKPGDDRYFKWEAFKTTVYFYIEVMNHNNTLSEGYKVSLIIQNLRRPAIHHATRIRDQMMTKAPVKKLTLENFMKRLDQIFACKELHNVTDLLFKISQQRDESVGEYFDRFSVLLTEMMVDNEVSKDVAVNLFINGLFEILKNKVTYRRQADRILDTYSVDQVDEAVLRCYQVAAAEEAAIISSGRPWLLQPHLPQKKSANGNVAKRTNSHSTDLSTNQPNSVNNNTNRTNSTSSYHSFTPQSRPNSQAPTSTPKPPKCYNCGELGHFGRNCKSKKSSFNMVDATADDDEEGPRSSVETESKN